MLTSINKSQPGCTKVKVPVLGVLGKIWRGRDGIGFSGRESPRTPLLAVYLFSGRGED